MNQLIKPGVAQKMSVTLQGDPGGGQLNIQAANVFPFQAVALCLHGAMFFMQQHAEMEAKIIRPRPAGNGEPAAAQLPETEVHARIRKTFEEIAEHHNKTFQAVQTLWNDVGTLLRKPDESNRAG
jgi:hypothetical protein